MVLRVWSSAGDVYLKVAQGERWSSTVSKSLKNQRAPPQYVRQGTEVSQGYEKGGVYSIARCANRACSSLQVWLVHARPIGGDGGGDGVEHACH